ncbi:MULTISPECIES: carbohydrate-binding protein [unclassified Candidatus Frackibacter]|uniref:carbohydrate-binding protein n=1 Tax=unclassified Candidatus Frackibacter TaxID=2648818 RepID=UPI00079AF355|nr:MULTISPECIES: carbohydrate-binding protein [unclassified Candidatus Frackibacter]KXS44408.1 MAG: carbohydrate binding family 25 [Candidatus Frackibacter sp. T328-2]SDC70673.1 Starch/carbohydrate-binding module (family 53) [Candidatus Frackibacter sp. WG11]SEM84834.1 Starch/carbohydrate-binding module (family 53) [Candidatus Frackibacter sp. WG12]SFL94071.1 Starch/carbohydrate-binding module (family 53) [Candidatus Frackibacter sp. WG13]
MSEFDSVNVNPTPITTGENVTIEYAGMLKEAGADEVYLHAGVGENQNWQDVKTIKMNWTPQGTCKTTVKLNTTQRFNFCFKDSAEHWDNNDGSNWSYEVHNGDQY